MCAGGPARGQQQGTGGGSGKGGAQPQAPSVPSLLDDSPVDGAGSIEAQQARMRNSDRQRQLVDDTQRLLSLANELKTEVDKSDKNTLSLEVIRKADEIEKLAHNVKEKMKGS
jgi:hypothetical protein